MRALVCGGRDFSDRATLFQVMDRLRAERGITHVITGAQRKFNRETKRWLGADYYAEEWARERCIWYTGLAANWNKHGPSAGPRRNQQMLDHFKPDVVIAFPGGVGTLDMMERAALAGVEVFEPLAEREAAGSSRRNHADDATGTDPSPIPSGGEEQGR